MAFLPKTFSQILKTSVDYFVGQRTTVTDVNVGSVARTLLEAAAIEEERIYVQMLEGLLEAIDTSAYNSFGFGLLSAVAAYGDVTLTRTGGYAPDITITPSMQFSVAGTAKVYGPVTTTVWTGGSSSTTATVKVQAKNAGAAGNTPANTITTIVTPLTGVASVTNGKTFVSGTDEETVDQRRARFNSYVYALPRATKAAVEYGSRTTKLLDNNNFVTERVARALSWEVNTNTATAVAAPGSVVVTPTSMVGIFVGTNLQVDTGSQQEIVSVTAVTSTTFTALWAKTHSGTWQILGIGNASVWVYNGVGTPGGTVTSAGLVTACQAVIDGTPTIAGYRSAGVTVTVRAATEVDTAVKVIITDVLPGFTVDLVRGAAIASIGSLIAGLNVGDSLFLSAITQVVNNVPGVRNSVIATPATDTVIDASKIVVSSTIQASRFTTSATTFLINVT